MTEIGPISDIRRIEFVAVKLSFSGERMAGGKPSANTTRLGAAAA